MKEHPIFMNGAMVRVTLAGDRKNTRRTKGLEYFSDNDPGNLRCVRVANPSVWVVEFRSIKP
ncbi:hypothetical protein [Herbaspirillum rubrisubalbicans]|uniref:Transposase n=1 Tax=Herbaspirillum rubrisubalbicans TaxID=80842 RepID=A0ABX9BYW1_9BURK|nr:hypothetical protein [Herbaspirillum rubrisubalbicans]RAM63115.1 hypothetical protein RB24_17465 [Herbaspirillum rubrisubalbicans]